MLKSYIALVAGFVDAKNQTMFFLSSEDNKYSCPRIAIESDSYKLSDYIALYLQTNTGVSQPETLRPVLVGAKKTDLAELDLIYFVHLPPITETKTETCFICGYNLAIIDPYIRKALQYV